MKINNDSDLIFDDDVRRLEIHFSPEIFERQMGYDKSDYILVDLLTWLKSFNVRITTIREEYQINVIPYPANPSEKQLLDIIRRHSPRERYEAFFDEIEKIRERYQLTPNWFLSLTSAIFMNTILIPPKLQTVQLYLPEWYPNDQAGEETHDLHQLSSSIFDSVDMRKAQEMATISKHPTIYFTHKITVDGFKKWIEDNKVLFRAMLRNLPARRVHKREEKARFWGKVAWIFKQEGVKTFSAIVTKIHDEADRYKDREEVKEGDVWYEPPGEIELEKYYQRFIQSLNRVENTK